VTARAGAWRGALAWLAAAVVVAPASVRANGAFPDSQSVLTPADRPREILLVTNFGLIMSADAGATWLWSCETDANAFGTLYQRAPAPQSRLFTVANQRLAFSDDGSCTWAKASGALAGPTVTDAFVDPTNGSRVLAIGLTAGSYAVYQSTDGGATFAPPLYTAPAGYTMTGVESARSDPQTIYVAMMSPETAPLLARSADGGAHFAVRDLGAALGRGQLRIVAVDPEDRDRVLMRFFATDTQALALTTDGGVSAASPVVISGNFTSFVRLPSGTLLVGAMADGAVVPALFRSHDRGDSFERLPASPSIRALSERGGVVYAATDNFGDGYALGASADEGDSWEPLLAYEQVAAIIPCLKSACQTSCQAEVDLGLWSEEVCSATAPMPPGAGGVSGAAGGAGAHGSGGAGGTPASRDGGCSVARTPTRRSAGSFATLLVAAAFARRRRSGLGCPARIVHHDQRPR
jgi:hypothetical protein